MMRVKINDNTTRKLSEEEISSAKPDLERIADIKIGELSLEDNPNLLVFPRDLHRYGDEISENCIISMRNDEISTGNIMGFVGVNDTQLDIKSRFAKVDEDDYFLHYMLQKVFSINLFNIKHTTRQEDIFDFLLYLFPHFLKKALAQGLFKKYRRFEYNDANIRGPIDVNRHIRENIPFRGTVAYSTREHSYDNEVTQLVRHAIEYIRTKEHGAIILNNDPETKSCITQITLATQSYNVRERMKVINQNLRPIRHPYYSAYTDLQNLCLRILHHESLKYGQEKDKVYGVLFDGAWLWEEYLAIVLKEKYNHFTKKFGPKFWLFNHNNKNSQQIIPDYLSKDGTVVADAKYIPLNKQLSYGENSEKATAIYYKTITYMYRFSTKISYLFYPYPEDESENIVEEFNIVETDAKLIKCGLKIPANCKTFLEFIQRVKDFEKIFLTSIPPLRFPAG